MDSTFVDSEKLYRAVFPESYAKMFWKKDGSVSSAAFLDAEGLSVERGDSRSDAAVIEDMQKFFKGCIVSVTVEQCRSVDAALKYKPTKRSRYHTEIHGSETIALLSSSQRKRLASAAKIEYYEE